MRITFDAVRPHPFCRGGLYLPSKSTLKLIQTLMRHLSTRMLTAGLSLALLFTAACNGGDDNNDGPVITPKGPPPAWAPGIHKEMQAVLEQLDSLNVPPLETLTPQLARAQKTIFDAADMLATTYGIPGILATADTFSRELPVTGGGTFHIRIYKPNIGAGPFPAILYYQDGGWVNSNVGTYDGSARALAEQTGVVLVSVEYRKGPEAKFPAAHNDAFTAYKWVIENAGLLSVDPTRLAVAGEGAGANLACNVSIAARNALIKVPNYQLLIYPVAQNDFTTASYIAYANAQPLYTSLMQWNFGHYLNNMAESADPRISLVNANLSGLPPTMILNAELDPLLDDGALLENKLKAAGVSVTRKVFNGVTHEFFGLGVVLPEARDAQGMASDALITALK
jgi:acetyl esterase/lipase